MQCFSCKTSAAELPVCNACGRATYCSRECQVQHWGQKHGHKFSCATKNAAGELIVHRDSLLGRVAAKNPQLFGATRQCEARKIAVPHSSAALALLATVQEAEMPEDDAKRAAADLPPPEDGSRKRHGESDRTMYKRPAAGPAVRTESETTIDSLPVEMLEAILLETDIETAVKLAKTSRTFASLFRRISDSPRILDMIAGERDPLDDEPDASWRAELLRRAIKTQLDNLEEVIRKEHNNLEDPVELEARLHTIMSAVRPMTFYALFLSLGRPQGFTHTIYNTYKDELKNFWLSENHRLRALFDDGPILSVMCAHPMVARVKDIGMLLKHAYRCDLTTSFLQTLVTTLSAYPDNYSLGYNLFRYIYDPYTLLRENPRSDFVVHIFRVSQTLTAVDWANLFYYSYLNDIQPLMYDGDEDSLNQEGNTFSGSPGNRPIGKFTQKIKDVALPYIPDKVADSLRDIFKDPTVARVDKQDHWRYIDLVGNNGENWDEMWGAVVEKLKIYRRSVITKPPTPTAMDAAAK